jgi:DNA recombination protein RmuC
MDQILLIICLVFALLSFLLCGVTFVFLLRQKKASPEAKENEALISLKTEIDSLQRGLNDLQGSLVSLKDNMKANDEASNAKQIAEIQKTLNDQVQKNADSMMEFQQKISNSISNDLANNQKMLSDQETKNNDSLRNFQGEVSKTLSDEFSKNQGVLTQQSQENTKSLNDFSVSINKTMNERMDKMNETLNQSIAGLNQKVDDNFKDINDRVNGSLSDGFKGTAETMGELKKQLGAIDVAQKNLQDVNSQIASLNTLLTGSQSRGAFGELNLEMLLESTFPGGKGKFYHIQDDLGLGTDEEKDIRPDATLTFMANGNEKKLCIDSKFPFADYSRLYSDSNLPEEEKESLKQSFKDAVKKQYKAIQAKYLIPGKTMDDAIMFIPNDGIFAFVENEFSDLVIDARNNHVIFACPSTLQAIIVIFHNAAVSEQRNENFEEMTKDLGLLSKDFERLAVRWDALQKNLNSALQKTKAMDTTVTKISHRFNSINEMSGNIAEIADDTEEDDDSEDENQEEPDSTDLSSK